MDNSTIISIFKNRVKTHPRRVALKVKIEKKYKDISWAEFGQSVRFLSLGLMEMGLEPRQNVAILSENRPEWAYSDLAIISCGAVTIPVYATDTANDVRYILNDSDARYIFVSNHEQLEKVLSIAKKTKLKKTIVFDKKEISNPLVCGFDEVLDFGKRLDGKSDTYEVRSSQPKPDDVATIIYTSGATGPPKGVMLTHDNFITNCKSCASLVGINENDLYLSFLPLSHVFERMAGFYLFLIQGGAIAYAEDINKVVSNMREVSPTIVCGVPRFFEKLYGRILDSAINGPRIRKNLFFWGYNVGRKCMEKKLQHNSKSFLLSIQKNLLTKRISKKFKDMFGARLRFFISGGAPLAQEIAKFFLAFDIHILEGYGLTESSPVISVNTLDCFKIGTVGKSIPGVEVRIAKDGEILARGPNIMKGYFNRSEDTKEAIKDGWLYTGDIGHLDEDNFLVITDRKKDIIVTSGGKNIAPLEIETALKADRYISDVMIYGDRRNYLTALVIPDFENLRKYANYKEIAHRNITELVKNPRIKEFIFRRINKLQKDLPRYAQIKKFIIMDNELTQARGELTPTMKIKRKVVIEEYKDLLDNLYEEKY